MSRAGWFAVVVLAVLCGWQFDHNRQSSAALVQRADAADAEVLRLGAQNRQYAKHLLDQAALQSALTGIGRQTAQIHQALEGQSAQLRHDLAELKRNDPDVNAYLSGRVPAAVGLLYVRPRTIDPVAWRAGSAPAVPADGVRAAGPPSSGR